MSRLSPSSPKALNRRQRPGTDRRSSRARWSLNRSRAIPAGGEVTVKITARAGKGGNLRFRAELNCSKPETKLVAEESTRFYGTAARSLSRSAVGQPIVERANSGSSLNVPQRMHSREVLRTSLSECG